MKVTPTPGSVSGRRIDRVGDPLEGLVNLFDLALVLAVGLLLAALSSAGVVGLVAGTGNGSGAGTPIPGQPSGGQTQQGKGTAVGTVYRLQDGSYVFAPSGAVKAGATGGTTSPAPTTGTGSTGTGGSTLSPTTGTGGGGSPGL